MKTIKDAYKELKGDLNNTYYFERDDEFLFHDKDDNTNPYIAYREKFTGDAHHYQYICTVEEFNNYKGDTVKDKMIKFDLERALAGDKVVTRDGREVTQLTKFDLDMNTNMFYVAAVVDGGILCRFSQYGLCSEHNGSDLFMAPKKLSGFIVVYADGHETREAAVKAGELVGVVKAVIDLSQFEEGHGL